MTFEQELKKVVGGKIRLAKEIHIEYKKMREHIKKLRRIKGYRQKRKENTKAVRKKMRKQLILIIKSLKNKSIIL